MSPVSYFLETKELPQCILAISVDKHQKYFRVIGLRKFKIQTTPKKGENKRKKG